MLVKLMPVKLQGLTLTVVSPVFPAGLYCCYAVIIVLTGAVIVLSVALSLSDTSNWTFSQNFCMELKTQLARFDNLEELNFLRRYKGTFEYWIGLHRESPQHPWRWMDNTEYNSSVPIRGVEKHAYLNNKWISSARSYADMRWICSMPNSCILQCQIPFASFLSLSRDAF
ncbi:C-type lectin domain family 2 member D11-like isoform X2 [Arvicola amphibius]|uniref:C-type lectin domain family 2 member D11-like isoform X2 n=1 Tax=Arvicola amphibius TaxID=1047088 RepID=UPI0018E34544|nr:C-type lectin domain family 2 member D11-like isoform X2 [Arvicola amphibius]